MRTVFVLTLALCLAACNRGNQSKDAVRQGVVEYLQGKQPPMNMAQMEVSVASVTFSGDNADATVSVGIKGGGAAQAMTIPYQLELRGGKWVVLPRQDIGGAPHPGAAVGNPNGGAAPAPAVANPHGGAMMPAPESLPPAGKKE